MYNIKLFTAFMVLGALFTTVVSSSFASSGPTPSAIISILEYEQATIHSFMGSESDAFVTTQIIELPNTLVVVDTQFTRHSAKQVRQYIDGLQKPIDRVIVSHSHPDHWFGLEFYPDVPIYALKAVRDEIDQFGDEMIRKKRAKMGDLVTDRTAAVTQLIKEGSEIIDGVTFEFKAIQDAESSVQLLIRLPEIKALIVQDLVYNGVHPFLGQNALANWKSVLKCLYSPNKYSTLLVGHGEPTSMSRLEEMLGYLDVADHSIATSKNAQELKAKLVKKFPDYRADFLIDMSGQYLYH